MKLLLPIGIASVMGIYKRIDSALGIHFFKEGDK